MKEKLRNQINRLEELQNIIDAQAEAANLGHSQAMSAIIEAQEEQNKITQRFKALALWVALAN
jgi:hypothetical protein